MYAMRDYLPEGTPPPIPAEPPPAPRPGYGTVWINTLDPDSWVASWQDGDGLEDFDGGTREEAVAWACSRPAARRMIWSGAAGDYIPLGRGRPR